ncbi:MAG: CotH kinase family protein [Lachnospiraceae bacterium]|nr:CotH kinase family protein [Lachnospiraceae bacterium]
MRRKNQRGILLCTMVFLLSVFLVSCSQMTGSGGNGFAGNGGDQGNHQGSANAGDFSGDLETEDQESTDAFPAPVFSVEAGFYGKTFHLELSARAGEEIYYTLDGSDPRTSETAKKYETAIKIYNNNKDANVFSAITDITLGEYHAPDFKVDKGMVVRAVAKTADGEFGTVGSNTYFVKKNEGYYSDFRVISMVTDGDYLFHPATGAYMVGTDYYKWLKSSDYVEYDPGDVQNPTNYNKQGKETEFPVSIQVFENGKAVYSDNVGARIAGNWTRAGGQKSFRLYARKEYGSSKMKYAFFDELTNVNGEQIKKFDKVTLRNGGNDHILHFRDAFIQELAKGLELDYMAAQPYILFVNGEFWGFYLMREKPEDYYIKSHYGIEDKDVCVIKNGELDSGADEDLEEYRQFTIWAATADMSVESNFKSFCEQMDVQSFMDYMTVETYINNHDWASEYTNNWMVWRSNVIDETLPKADGKWRFILYDLDFSSGLYDSPDTAYDYDGLNNNFVVFEEYNLPQILRNLCGNESFRKQFYDNYIRIVENNFDAKKVKKLLEEYVKKYKPAMQDTHLRFDMEWAAGLYEDEADKLCRFFEKRPTYAKEYLDYFIQNWNQMPGEAGGQAGGQAGGDTQGNTNSQDTTNFIPDITLWYYYGEATFEVDEAQNAFIAKVPKAVEYSWNIQAGASGVPLEYGQKYHLSFEGYTSGTGEFELFINRFDDGDYPTKGISSFEFTHEPTTYDFYFTWDMESHNDWTVCLNYGLCEGEFVVRNLHLEKVE